MRGGSCPSCKKKELYTRYSKPWLLICGRESKCAKSWHVKELYEDLFDDWSNQAPAAEQNPTATARAYLAFARGFRLELIEGTFTQEQYWPRDWNDLHQRWQFIDDTKKRDEQIGKDLNTARYYGALLIAESAEEKGLLMYEWRERQEFYFGFDSRLYWFKMDLVKFHKTKQGLEGSDKYEDQLLNEKQLRDKALREGGTVVEIANCYPEALYYQRNEVTD